MRIKACVRCGSTGLDFAPGNGDSILTRIGVGPVAGIARCKKCGHLGGPIVFENEKSYKAFLKSLKDRRD